MLWRKLITPTAAVSILWLAVGGATAYYLDWVCRSHALDLAENFTSLQAADAMQDVLWQLQATAIEVAEHADSHTRYEVAELEREFEKHMAAAAAGSEDQEGLAVIKAIAEQFTAYRQGIRARLEFDPAEHAKATPPAELSRLAHTIAESCKSLMRIQERVIADSTAQRGRMRAAFGHVMLALWIVGPVVGIVSGLWIASRLQRSISRISISLKDAAGGLDQEVGNVDVMPSDDLPALQEQVHKVSSRIQEMVDALQQARRETMRADRLAAVGEMAAGVAHEMRNPLTSIKLLMQTATEGPPAETLTEEHVHVVLEQVIRMENTIQGLLDFARPPRMQKSSHDLRETLHGALNLMEGHARQQGVVTDSDCPSSPVFVDADPEQLHQVFVNLLLNGVESMPDGGQLQIGMQCENQPAPLVRVSFRDTGTGIPENILQRIFEPFVSGKERGTGLGLAICRRIIEQHGGRLTAANREPCGAIFTVALPMLPQKSALDQEPADALAAHP